MIVSSAVAFVAVDSSREGSTRLRLISMLGLSLTLLLATLFSLRPKKIKWRLVVICLAFNYLAALFVTRVPGASEGVSCLFSKARWTWRRTEDGLFVVVGGDFGMDKQVRESSVSSRVITRISLLFKLGFHVAGFFARFDSSDFCTICNCV